ncbi:MAG: hypothetical protein R3D32_01530 [Nitratireductor sp.]
MPQRSSELQLGVNAPLTALAAQVVEMNIAGLPVASPHNSIFHAQGALHFSFTCQHQLAEPLLSAAQSCETLKQNRFREWQLA